MCCQAGSVLTDVVTRRCNLNHQVFHYFVNELLRRGWLSSKLIWNNGKEVPVYHTTREGLVFLQQFNDLQTSVAPLEGSFGKLLV